MIRPTHLRALCALFGAVLATLLGAVGCLGAEDESREATARLTEIAAQVAPRVTAALDRSPGTAPRPLLDTLSHEYRARLSVRLSRRGTALTRTRVAPVELLPDEGSYLCVRVSVPAGGGGRTAELLVRRSADGLRDRILEIWAGLVVVLVSLLSCCLLTARALHRRSAASVRQLGSAVHALAEGAYDVRAVTASHRQEDHLDELARGINHLATTVQRAMEEYRAFLSDVAHQLRNPLIALRLRIENLAGCPPERVAERHTQLVDDVDRLDRTLTEMLEHARRLPADHETRIVDVCGVVEECVRGWAVVAEQRAVRLRLSRPRHAWVLARPGAVEQALNILLDNALKHAPEASTVQLSITTAGPRVRVEVCDEGPGLPHAEREDALERGWSRGAAAGNGIGLPIAAKLLAVCGGRLELRSAAPDEPRGTGRGLRAVLHLAGAVPELAETRTESA